MRRWRVGTLSLGVLLIVLGVIMLAAQFRQVVILDALLTWWPLVLVLIGAEILWHVYSAKESEPRIKYDVFSMFIIFIVVFCSIGAYALTATGVVEGISWMVQSSIMSVEVPSQRTAVDEGIERIVVYVPRGKLDIKRSSTAEVVSFGQASVNVTDRQEANALVEQSTAAVHREGDTLFVQFVSNNWSGDFKPGIREIRHTLLLPSNVDIEISGSDYFNLNIDGRALAGDWLVKGSGTVSVIVTHGADLAIDAQVKEPDQLGGSVNWQIEEMSTASENQRPAYKGSVAWGEGKNSLRVMIDGGEIAVNPI